MAGIYVHIPFCRAKCFYCDFYSTPRSDLYSTFTDALINEWHHRKHLFDDQQFRTLYIGGGTPSSLPREQLARIFELFGQLAFDEATIEVNPEDVSTEFLRFLKNSPVSRISMGIQSAVDAELSLIGRRHNASAAIRSAELIKQHNFSLSLDLIYGLPTQSLQSWEYSLRKILDISPEHISAYLLSYEPQTRLTQMKSRGKVAELSDSDALRFYDVLCQTMESFGFTHYEISNFARPGHIAIHNSNYWNLTPYIGLGPGAHSFDGTYRSFNPPSVKDYIASGGIDFNVIEDVQPNDRINDYIIIRLRTAEGLSLSEYQRLFGEKETRRLLDEARKLIPSQKLTVSDQIISIPETHWLISDSIIESLIKID